MTNQGFYLMTLNQLDKLTDFLENDFVTPEFVETDHGIGHWECHGQVGYQSIPALELVEESVYFFFQNEKKTLVEFMEIIDDHLEYYTSWQNYSTEEVGAEYRMRYAIYPVERSIGETRPGGYLLEIYWEQGGW